VGHRHWALAVSFGAWLAAAGALAQPVERGKFRLAWHAPPGCPTAHEALARIEALLGARVTEILAEPMAARATVSLAGDGRYELMLETFQGEQRFTRSMQAASCAELTDAGALVLALAIDPTLSERRAAEANVSVVPPPPVEPTERGPDTEAAPTAPVATTALAKPPPPAALAPPAAARTPARTPDQLRFGVLGTATLDVGTIATVAVGPSLGVGVQWRSVEASLGALWLPPRRSYAEPGKGGDITLVTGQLRGCYRPFQGDWQLLGCGTFELGVISGKGAGTATRFDPSATWIAPGAMISGRRRLGSSFVLSFGAGAQIPLQPIDFTLENVGVVHSVPVLVPRVELGAGGFFG